MPTLFHAVIRFFLNDCLLSRSSEVLFSDESPDNLRDGIRDWLSDNAVGFSTLWFGDSVYGFSGASCVFQIDVVQD